LRDWRAGPWLGFLLALVHHFGYHLAAFKQVSNLVPFPRVRAAGFCALASRVPFPPLRFSSSWFFCSPLLLAHCSADLRATVVRLVKGFGYRLPVWDWRLVSLWPSNLPVVPPPPYFGPSLSYRHSSKFLLARFSPARAQRGCRRCGIRPPPFRAPHARPSVPGSHPRRQTQPPFNSSANQGFSQSCSPSCSGVRRPRPGPSPLDSRQGPRCP
jgi:hypothetical protein